MCLFQLGVRSVFIEYDAVNIMYHSTFNMRHMRLFQLEVSRVVLGCADLGVVIFGYTKSPSPQNPENPLKNPERTPPPAGSRPGPPARPPPGSNPAPPRHPVNQRRLPERPRAQPGARLPGPGPTVCKVPGWQFGFCSGGGGGGGV